MAESEVKAIGAGELRGIVVDSDELQKGARIFDEKGLLNLSRHDNKLFCEAKGSGPSPYRVSLVFGDGALSVKGRCTCPAAFSRAFCKHAAALLVAWARAPEAFVVSDAPPPGAPGAARKKAVKRGTAAASDLMKQGVAQVVALVRELGVAGVASMGGDRAPVVQALGESLRDYKLRRLSAKTLDLVELLAVEAQRRGSLPALVYTDLACDLLLTARKLSKHLEGGEPLDDRHVEELVGKTWQKADRRPIAGLDLVEYAYLSRITSDEYAIRESRFFDLGSGVHYSEKQIVPVFLARTDPKPSRGGAVLSGVRGSTYPGYPPTRLEVSDLGDPRPVDHAALGRLVERALPDVGSALGALQEHRRDVFAPDLFPAAIRVDTLFARAGRVQAVDATGQALHLADDRALEDRLGSALGGARLSVLLGDVGVDGALPTLWPMAAVIEGPLGLELRTLVASKEGASAKHASVAPPIAAAAWAPAARASGASAAAIALAEVREAMADAFVVGLASLGARAAEPLEARLRELGLEKQAVLLHALATRADAEGKLDDFVKLYQVLGIALVRLAGATTVDRATMARVPTYESVFVARPERWLDPPEIAAQRAAGALDRYEAAVHYAHHYEGLPPEELGAAIYPTWADGSASPYVVRAFAGRRAEGLAAARRALAGKRGRVARITALRVLAEVGGLEAERILHEAAASERDIGLRGLAADAIDVLEVRTLGAEAVQRRRAPTLARVAEGTALLGSAPNKEIRKAAVHKLVELGHLSAIPALRQAFLVDAAQEVRREAAIALALLGDTEMVDTFVGMLSRRTGDGDREAKIAADALGQLGDVRGLRELLAAYREGYKPAIVAEALRAMGPAAIEPLIEVIEQSPALADRRASRSVLEQLPDQELTATLTARLAEKAGSASYAALAALYLDLAAVHPDCRRAVAKAVLDAVRDPEADKALVKAARKAMS
jgi:HEAT repeat protein